MQPRSDGRVHGAEFKARVLAECQQPGASVVAVALAHGLNVNLVRAHSAAVRLVPCARMPVSLDRNRRS
jgi:transposase-like protein